MLRACRPFSLGEHSLDRGDEVTDAMVASLPPRRLDVLIDQRYVERISDEEQFDALRAEISKLRKPAARKKVAA